MSDEATGPSPFGFFCSSLALLVMVVIAVPTERRLRMVAWDKKVLKKYFHRVDLGLSLIHI